MKRKLGVIADCIEGVSPVENLKIIKDVGFDSVFTGVFDIKGVSEIKNEADKLGLEIEFLHAPFNKINTMWLPGDDYREIDGKMRESIISASETGIPAVVVHLSSGWYPPEICDLGLARYDALVNLAVQNGVKIAFENLRKVGNVAYFIDRYIKVPEVGLCYDVGHEHCYTVSADFMGICGERTICTHFHDNFGRDKKDLSCDPDIHLLPFDGNIDYKKVMDGLNGVGYEGSIMLEVFDGSKKDGVKYNEIMTREQFIRESFRRAVKINQLGE